jgi:hypothetical protein
MARFVNRHVTFRGRKVGGIRFLRLGRFQISFCVCRRVEG